MSIRIQVIFVIKTSMTTVRILFFFHAAVKCQPIHNTEFIWLIDTLDIFPRKKGGRKTNVGTQKTEHFGMIRIRFPKEVLGIQIRTWEIFRLILWLLYSNMNKSVLILAIMCHCCCCSSLSLMSASNLFFCQYSCINLTSKKYSHCVCVCKVGAFVLFWCNFSLMTALTSIQPVE